MGRAAGWLFALGKTLNIEQAGVGKNQRLFGGLAGTRPAAPSVIVDRDAPSYLALLAQVRRWLRAKGIAVDEDAVNSETRTFVMAVYAW